ncbi:MAG: DNA translocase FtsK 4TM domain-containing protein [Proteobacteria bacterium]|nr:cell division protein FtsK [Desulfobulbaceae bacterium]MBU4153204.1 DNA translocase FtsK 4TM domain-containing protein [Pseudomonadota bacterium]MDP2107302.1 DNA translocase FtsK 4TM domain-containing protein [Desulfobulbaceae bacterium]
MAKASNVPDSISGPSLGQEIIAIAGLCFALFLLISLVSFSGSSTTNWGGWLGNFCANLLTWTFGLSAFWLVFFFFYFPFQIFFQKKNIDRLPAILAGGTLFLLSASTLLAVCPVQEISFFFGSYPVAGTIGSSLFATISPFLGRPGFVVVCLFLCLISLMITVQFSPYRLMSVVSEWVVASYQRRKNGYFNDKVAAVSESTEREPKRRDLQNADRAGVVPKVNEPVRIATDLDTDFKPLPVAEGDFALPPVTLLDKPDESLTPEVDREHYLAVSKKLESKLEDFGVEGHVVGISPGPVITTYEYSPAPGVKISRIVSLENDLAMVLKTESVRIAGSIPGKAALGIEIPNPIRQMVYIREILGNEKFLKGVRPLTLGLGKDVVGRPVYANLIDMPHLLIAGATGAGKSVGINTIICSILLNSTPDEVRLLMVDPKRIELSAYEAIPHLLHPVVVDPKMASRALQWAVLEMERRYSLMEELKVKSLATYNEAADEKLPLIVIIIDELADLMMVASKDVEGSVARLAQMARAAGMHLILATQRPSVDVLTGLIKANFPTRMSFKVSSKIDSRTILDASGAEHLLGKGDMLFMAPGTNRMQRIHGAYISEKEIGRIVDFLKAQRPVNYDESVMRIAEESNGEGGSDEVAQDYDEKYDEAVEFVCESGQASISMVQRRLRVGYNRAARMIEIMEREGIVGPSDGAKPREVLTRRTY